jgi:hypothetical protein
VSLFFCRDYKGKIGSLLRNFIENSEQYGCPLPCTVRTFNPLLNTFHDVYEFPDEDTEHLRLFVNYASKTVEKKEEYFIYDLMTLASSLGGTLGLLLGYSLLSILLSIINFLESYILNFLATRK